MFTEAMRKTRIPWRTNLWSTQHGSLMFPSLANTPLSLNRSPSRPPRHSRFLLSSSLVRSGARFESLALRALLLTHSIPRRWPAILRTEYIIKNVVYHCQLLQRPLTQLFAQSPILPTLPAIYASTECPSCACFLISEGFERDAGQKHYRDSYARYAPC